MLATYSSIASDLGKLEDGAWLLTGYQLGYSVALPVVREIEPLTSSYGLMKWLA